MYTLPNHFADAAKAAMQEVMQDGYDIVIVKLEINHNIKAFHQLELIFEGSSLIAFQLGIKIGKYLEREVHT